jgi:hypothetical protein
MTQSGILIKNTMTWPRFLGLFQCDGSFGFTPLQDGSVRPWMALSMGQKAQELRISAEQFMRNEGLSPQSQTDVDGRGDNVRVEGIEGCVQFVRKLDAVKVDNVSISLLGDKKADYELFKSGLEICSQLKSLGTYKANAAARFALKQQICSLILNFRVLRDTNYVLTEEEVKERLLKDKDSVLVDVNPVFKDAQVKAENHFNAFGNYCKRLNKVDITQLPEEVGEFCAGVIEGDGSFQVGTHTHVDKNDAPQTRKPSKGQSRGGDRPRFEFVPMLTVTDKETRGDRPVRHLFVIFALLFNAPKDCPLYEVPCPGYKPKAQSARIQIRSQKNLKARLVPLIKKHRMITPRLQGRYDMMVYFLGKLPIKSADVALDCLERLHSSPYFDPEDRTVPKERMARLIRLDFGVESS